VTQEPALVAVPAANKCSDERRRGAVLLGAPLLLLLLWGCEGRQEQNEGQTANGDVRHGAQLVASLGCGSCHSVPGIAGAQGLVGPPLDHMGRRIYIAGVLRNSPDNMAAWLRDPQRFVPGNAMPNMGINEQDARDLTAYLYTLR
jgi:cytochrome c2